MNLSFDKSIFQHMYKIPIVIPRHKSKDLKDISLISPIAKIIEKLSKIQLQRIIINKNAINTKQFGFKQHIDTQNAI